MRTPKSLWSTSSAANSSGFCTWTRAAPRRSPSSTERERERQRLEQEINIARDIQRALLPRDFPNTPEFAITGVNFPCLSVGGDYFDVFPLGDGRTAFVIADVSGKGLGAAIVTTMLQGALSGMTLGTDPARVFNHVNRGASFAISYSSRCGGRSVH